MSAKIIDGKKIAGEIKEELKREIAGLKEKNITPGLAVIIVGTDPGSVVYVRNKKKTAEDLGIYSEVFELPENTNSNIAPVISKNNDAPDFAGATAKQLDDPLTKE